MAASIGPVRRKDSETVCAASMGVGVILLPPAAGLLGGRRVFDTLATDLVLHVDLSVAARRQARIVKVAFAVSLGVAAPVLVND